MSSTDTSPEQPKKRGRKVVDQKKRRCWIVCCPKCKHTFDFAHRDPTVKPEPITTPGMDPKEKNKIYQARYRLKHQNKLLDNDIDVSRIQVS